MYELTADGKSISVFPGSEPGAPVIYLSAADGEGQKVYEAVLAAGCRTFTLVAVSGLDWNRELAPWDSSPASKKGEPFTGGADGYLRLLVEDILPRVEDGLIGPPAWRGIAGYSLAGLFALYAVYRTNIFSRVGSVSGSLWFPGLREYVLTREPKRWPDCVYFSLGDKECMTRNPVLRDVRENTEEICGHYRTMGVDTVFQMNPGNHFDHPVERTAAGITWLLGR